MKLHSEVEKNILIKILVPDNLQCMSSWIYENVREREEGKEEGEKKKTEHSYVFISSTLGIVFE